MEKLKERQKVLLKAPAEPLTPDLEKFRLRFLSQSPKSTSSVSLQLLRLEKELGDLLKAA